MSFAQAIDTRLGCAHPWPMPRIIQIRNVPDRLHVELKGRAADAGQSLSDYILSRIGEAASKTKSTTPSVRVQRGPKVKVKSPVAAAVLRKLRGV